MSHAPLDATIAVPPLRYAVERFLYAAMDATPEALSRCPFAWSADVNDYSGRVQVTLGAGEHAVTGEGGTLEEAVGDAVDRSPVLRAKLAELVNLRECAREYKRGSYGGRFCGD